MNLIWCSFPFSILVKIKQIMISERFNINYTVLAMASSNAVSNVAEKYAPLLCDLNKRFLNFEELPVLGARGEWKTLISR